LSFRELPVLLSAFEKLQQKPEGILCDGQGIAHPRGLGLASHLGYELNIPAIGCGKTRLVGEYEDVGLTKWSEEALTYKGNHVGSVLRTRDKIRPLFISPGHLINIEDSIAIVKQCVRKYSQPEPNRIAHHVITRYRKECKTHDLSIF
jgi:deoxyribonuclease V